MKSVAKPSLVFFQSDLLFYIVAARPNYHTDGSSRGQVRGNVWTSWFKSSHKVRIPFCTYHRHGSSDIVLLGLPYGLLNSSLMQSSKLRNKLQAMLSYAVKELVIQHL